MGGPPDPDGTCNISIREAVQLLPVQQRALIRCWRRRGRWSAPDPPDFADALTTLNDDHSFLYWPKEFKAMSPKLAGFVHISDGMIRLRHAWLNP
jgi:hypothetical protein